MNFTKYVAAGNDFLAFIEEDINGINYNDLALKICNRRFGIGADGILIASKTPKADIKMLYYNSDGSQGEMCGNGIRAFAKFVYEKNLVIKEEMAIETLDNIKYAKLEVSNKLVESIEVDMGLPSLSPKDIPAKINKDKVVNESLTIDGINLTYSALRLGVPHLIIFLEKVDKRIINTLGPKIENHDLFPEKINVNFVEINSREDINIYTWERGAGRTLGCGTGSCASVYMGNYLGFLDKKVLVHTEGGELRVNLDRGVYMSGGASLIGEGRYFYK